MTTKTCRSIVYQILHSCEAVNRCRQVREAPSVFCLNSRTPFQRDSKEEEQKATAVLPNQEKCMRQMECAMQRTRGCFKSSRGCVAVWTCQTLIEREKDHRHSKLKITDTVLIELKLFRLYALNRAEPTVRNNKCHMRNQSTVSSAWWY